jgi:hypothetical protein
MRYLKTTTILLTAGFALMAGSVAHATTIEELILDAGGGVTATIDVDDLGFVSCSGPGCGSLNFPTTIIPHHQLVATSKAPGSFGGFTVSVTGNGGAEVSSPTLQNLTQSNVLFTGSGPATFSTSFTDTGYCVTNTPGFPGGGCFGGAFRLDMTTNPDTSVGATSTTTFAAFVSPGTTIPAGMLINGPAGTTLIGLDAVAETRGNPNGTGGSLTSTTVTTFPHAGGVLTTFTISSAAIPEPSTFAFFGLATGLAVFKLRRRKV